MNMAIRVDEVGEILKSKIKKFEKVLEAKDTGTVLSTGDGVARVYGLEAAIAGELVEFSGGAEGRADAGTE
jgi:F-type H+-transporting ATPase subunit alpha